MDGVLEVLGATSDMPCREPAHDQGRRSTGKTMTEHVVAIMLFHEGEEANTWIEHAIEEAGGNIRVEEWLAKTIQEGGIEMSGMASLFYRRAGRYR